MVRPFNHLKRTGGLSVKHRVIVKRTLIHDDHGPLGSKKRRASSTKASSRGKKKTFYAGSTNTSRSTTPYFDDSGSDDEATSQIESSVSTSLHKQGLKPATFLESAAGSKDRSHLKRNSTENNPLLSTGGIKRSRLTPRFTLPVKAPRVDGPLYCYCNYSAYDEMVACSGANCEKQYVSLQVTRPHWSPR